MSDNSTVEVNGNVLNPYTIRQADNSLAAIGLAPDESTLISWAHGSGFQAAARGALFTFNVTAVTVPVVASGLVSVFSLYNPVNSNRWLELVDFDASIVLATTVVDTIGLYFSNGALTGKGTFTTAGTPLPGQVGASIGGQGVPYSAFTHSGTPVRHRILGGWGATTDPTSSMIHYEFQGRTIVPPGVAVSVAMTTAASTASGVDLGMSWIESPIF